MFTRFALVALIGLSVLGCASNKKGDTCGDACCAAEGEAGWKSLFDGKTLTGWKSFRAAAVSPGWAVQDGAIARVGAGAGSLITVEQFSNFDLTFEWKVAAKSNSGVFYTVTEEAEDGLITGPEYQVLDNALHADGKNPLTSAASNYALYAPVKDATKPVGEWNQGRILVDGGHVEHWLNGVKVVDYDLDSADWKARVAASKFSKLPAYGTRRKGHLGLQDHGDPAWYRNIKIKELPAK